MSHTHMYLQSLLLTAHLTVQTVLDVSSYIEIASKHDANTGLERQVGGKTDHMSVLPGLLVIS